MVKLPSLVETGLLIWLLVIQCKRTQSKNQFLQFFLSENARSWETNGRLNSSSRSLQFSQVCAQVKDDNLKSSFFVVFHKWRRKVYPAQRQATTPSLLCSVRDNFEETLCTAVQYTPWNVLYHTSLKNYAPFP